MVGAAPAWVGDVTQVLSLVLAGAASVGIAWRIIKPGVHASIGDIVDRVTRPRFEKIETTLDEVRTDLTRRIDESDARLDEHTRNEESATRSLHDLLVAVLKDAHR